MVTGLHVTTWLYSTSFSVGVAELLQILQQRALYMYTLMYCSLSEISLCTALRVASVCGQREECGSKTRIARQPSCDRNKTPHPKTVQYKTVAVTNISNKPPGWCPQGRGQDVSLSTFDLGVWHGMTTPLRPPPFFWYSWLTRGKKPRSTEESGRHMREIVL